MIKQILILWSTRCKGFDNEEGYNTRIFDPCSSYYSNLDSGKDHMQAFGHQHDDATYLTTTTTHIDGEETSLVSVEQDNKGKPQTIFLSLQEIVKNSTRGNTQQQHESSSTGIAAAALEEAKEQLSTEDILRLSGKCFIQSSLQIASNYPSSPLDTEFYNLSNGEKSDVELALNLLAAAEKVGQRGYDLATKLLTQLDTLCSDTGNPVQRIVYYFSKALREKIDIETGRNTCKHLGQKQLSDIENVRMAPSSTNIAFHIEVPFNQVCQFAGMQAIVEHVEEAKKVHLIDIDIRTGVQCIILMKALAIRYSCRLELLKITAIGTKSESILQDTGERLTSFAESLNIPFMFNIVMVSDMLELNKDLFDLEDDETVAVYGSYALWLMILKEDELEALIRTVRSMEPCIFVLIEIEGNLNSPVFVKRFVEALFYYGAYFDCIEDCMERKDKDRKLIELIHFSRAIRNVVGAEGEERKIRHVKIGVWRAFLARFGMVEKELSAASFYQATLLAKSFTRGGHSCSFTMDGKSLLVGWKGSPLHSVSAWKFA